MDAIMDLGRPSQSSSPCLWTGAQGTSDKGGFCGKEHPTSKMRREGPARRRGRRRQGGPRMSLQSKDLLGIKELAAEDIELIIETASGFKDVLGRDIKKVPALRGKTAVNLFYEPSTRTRTSFELAAKRLSADLINISTSTSSVVKERP